MDVDGLLPPPMSAEANKGVVVVRLHVRRMQVTLRVDATKLYLARKLSTMRALACKLMLMRHTRAPGTSVTICGLQSASSLNGKRAALLDWHADTGRWGVRTATGRILAIRPRNLTPDVSETVCLEQPVHVRIRTCWRVEPDGPPVTRAMGKGDLRRLEDHFCSSACPASPHDRLVARAALLLMTHLSGGDRRLSDVLSFRLVHVRMGLLQAGLPDGIRIFQLPDDVGKDRQFSALPHRYGPAVGTGVCALDATLDVITYSAEVLIAKMDEWRAVGRGEDDVFLLHTEGRPTEMFDPAALEHLLSNAMLAVGISPTPSADAVVQATSDIMHALGLTDAACHDSFLDLAPKDIVDFTRRASASAVIPELLTSPGLGEPLYQLQQQTELLTLIRQAGRNAITTSVLKKRMWGPGWPLHDLLETRCAGSAQLRRLQKRVAKNTRRDLRGESNCLTARECAQCRVAEEGEQQFNICARCRVVVYCSKACQRAHWGAHKKDCKPWPVRNAGR